MKGFTELETKRLIEVIKNAKSNGKSLLFAFNEFAKESNRAIGSVRNYYYKTIKKCKNSKSLMQKLGVDESLFPAFILEFNSLQESELLTSVLTGITNGKSVRRAISEYSYGNEKLALRNQNKYRNLLKTKPQLVNEVIKTVEKNLGQCKNPYLELSYNLQSKIALEESINNLLNSLKNESLKENNALTKKVNELSIQNKKMKELLKRALKNSNITKDFIKNAT